MRRDLSMGWRVQGFINAFAVRSPLPVIGRAKKASVPAALSATTWVDHCPSPAAAVDAEGRVTAANAAFAACMSCGATRLAGEELATWAIDPPALRDFLREDCGSTREFWLRAGDGSERRLEMSLGKRAIGRDRLLTAVDVTERRAELETAQQENERFRDIVSIGGGTFYEINAELTQIRIWECIGGTLAIRERRVKYPDDTFDLSFNPEGVADAMKRYAARQPVTLLFRVPNTEGKEIYRLGRSVPFYDHQGQYQGRRGVSVDVTAQVVAESALRDNEAQLRLAREHLEHAQRVAATGSSERDLVTGTIVWSEEMYHLAGVERASFVLTDANIFGLVHEEDRERMTSVVVTGRKGIRPAPTEFRLRRPGGEIRTLYCETDVIQDTAGKPVRVLTVFKDVTELRAAERRQQEMEQQFLHAQKLESLGTLAGGVAHELNNMLVPMLALAKLTARRLPEGSRDQRNVTTILKASERARDLVKQILAFGRKETPMRRSVDVAELTREAMRMLRLSVPSTIRVVEAIEAVPPILADPGQLHQIITNLVGNAAQAIGGRLGTITIEVTARACGEVSIGSEEAHTGIIRLSVSDTGCGMDEATQARVFEPFFTTKAVGQGTGLGLSVVHGIVTQHGGHMSVKSRLGEGTRFDVFLPRLTSEAAVRPETSELVIP
jgi:PAS domain S-box-containing protein